jgi:hypothetical protein
MVLWRGRYPVPKKGEPRGIRDEHFVLLQDETDNFWVKLLVAFEESLNEEQKKELQSTFQLWLSDDTRSYTAPEFYVALVRQHVRRIAEVARVIQGSEENYIRGLLGANYLP